MPVDVVKRGIDLHAEVDMYLLDDEVVVSVTHIYMYSFHGQGYAGWMDKH